MLENDPSKQLLFDFLRNDQSGKLINSAFSYHTYIEDGDVQVQPANIAHNIKSGNPFSYKYLMGCDEMTTLDDQGVRDMKFKKHNKKQAPISKEELFTDFLVDLFSVDGGQQSNPFAQKAA